MVGFFFGSYWVFMENLEWVNFYFEVVVVFIDVFLEVFVDLDMDGFEGVLFDLYGLFGVKVYFVFEFG